MPEITKYSGVMMKLPMSLEEVDHSDSLSRSGSAASAPTVRGRNRVVAAGGPGVAARQPAYGEPAALDAAVHRDRLESVGRARRVVPADLPVQRADHEAVAAQQPDQQVLHRHHLPGRPERRGDRPCRGNGPARRELRRTTPRRPPAAPGRRAARRREQGQPLADQVPQPALDPVADDRGADRLGPRSPTRGAVGTVGARSGDARGGPPECEPPRRRPGARPRGGRKAAGQVSRCSAASTRRPAGARGLRQRGSCGPCGDGRTGWRGRRGCACAAGSRGSCADDGCSAGTCACSRAITPGGWTAVGCTGSCGRVVASCGQLAPLARRRPVTADSHGHAAPVDAG